MDSVRRQSPCYIPEQHTVKPSPHVTLWVNSLQSSSSPWSGSRANTTATGVLTVVLSKTATAQWLGKKWGALSFTSSTWRITSAWHDWPPPSVALATRLYISFFSRSRAVRVVSSPGQRNDSRWAFPGAHYSSTCLLGIYARQPEAHRVLLLRDIKGSVLPTVVRKEVQSHICLPP